MHTLHGLLKARFNVPRRYLNAILSRLSEADLAWSPAEGMRTVAGQLLETANKEKECLAWLKQGGGDWPDGSPDAFDKTADLKEIKAAFESLRAETLAYIDSLSEAELEEPISSPEGWWEAMGLTRCPRSEVLRNIAAHEWYHAGQLITYLWLRGDNPYVW